MYFWSYYEDRQIFKKGSSSFIWLRLKKIERRGITYRKIKTTGRAMSRCSPYEKKTRENRPMYLNFV